MAEWRAEITVTAELATQLIRSQFPDVEARRVTLLGAGWDNTVFLVDDTLVFRFPRREVALPGVRREMAVMPRLAPRLPLPVPAPVHLGTPCAEFPWPFFGCALVRGRESAEAALSDDARAALARPLGTFLRALHDADVHRTFRDDVPVDPMGRADMAARVPKTVARLVELRTLGLWDSPVPRFLDGAARLPSPTPRALLHGDLHFRHLLVDEAGALSGIIDWGDLHQGDPGVDLQLMWSFLPSSARKDFLAAYGPVEEASLVRARVLALFLAATLAAYGHQEGMEAVKREALSGLARASSE
ncbi:MAG: phosphotransferase [Myxococcota bacterium]